MTISETVFGDAPFKNEEWIHQLWAEELCDPANWKAPSTHGVPGVYFIGPDGAKYTDAHTEDERRRSLFMHAPVISDNPVRDQDTVIKRIIKYAEVFSDPNKGVKTGQDPVYYDIDTDDITGGNGRSGAAAKLGIPGYMHARTEYVSDEARIQHAMASQPKKDNSIFGTVMSKEDVKAGIKALVKSVGSYTIDEVYKEVDKKGLEHDLTASDVLWVKTQIKLELELDGTVECTDIIKSYSDYLYEPHIEKYTDNPWYEDVWKKFKEDDAIVVYINLDNKTISNAYKVLVKAQKKSIDMGGAPVNLLVNFDVKKALKGTSTLQAQRDSFFSQIMHTYEQEHLDVYVKQLHGVDHRVIFPWNYKDARHVTLTQDRINETDTSVVYLKNRDYN